MPPPPAIAPATELQFAEALRFLDAGDFGAARPILERLVAGEPTLAAPAINLGMLHAREKRWPEAEASLAEGIRRDPASAVAFNELASVQRETGRFRTRKAPTSRRWRLIRSITARIGTLRVLLDLYLWRPAEALQNLEAYLSKSGTADRQVSGWIAELKRRVGEVAQTAEVQP